MPSFPLIPAAARSQELPCDLGATRPFCQQARQFFAEAGLAGAELDGWELALAEGLNNAVKHCPPEARALPIRVDLLVGPDWAEARITDHTPGFEWPQPARLPPDDSESGRGLFLIQQLTDQASYLRGPGENCLILRRRRAPSATVAPAAPADPGQDLREVQHTLDLMTEELASAYESLSAIFRFSAELQGGVAATEVVHRWLARLLDITEAEWVALRLHQPSLGHLRLEMASTKAHGPIALRPDVALTEARALEVRAATERSDIWFDALSRPAPDDPLAALAGHGCGFSHPLVVNGALIGVLTLGRHDGDRPFAAGQVSVIHTFGDFVGLQIHTSQMREEQVRARLNTRDLEIAANLQQTLLPAQLPSLPCTSLARFYRSARQVGGDYYDALPAGEGQLLLAVADVMGKGLPAALFAFVFRGLVRSRLDLAARPGDFLAWLNRHLFEELDRAEMFITAQLAFLDCRRGEIRVAAAGHPPLLLANTAGEVAEVAVGGPPLGILRAASFPEDCRPWPAGCALMFTDGLIEARNAQDELLGLEAVKEALAVAARDGESSAATQQRLARVLDDFVQGAAPVDDTAFLVIAKTQPPCHEPQDSHRG